MGKVILYTVNLALWCCFLFQGWMSLKKYLPGDTVNVRKREYKSSIEMPMLTICKKGFKVEDDSGNVVNITYSDTAFILSSFCSSYSDLQKCLNGRLYHEEELLEAGFLGIFKDFMRQEEASIEARMEAYATAPPPYTMEHHYIPTGAYGMCYRVKFKFPTMDIGSEKSLVLKLKKGQYDIYAHDPKLALLGYLVSSDTSTPVSKVALTFDVPDDDPNVFRTTYMGLERESVTLLNTAEKPCESDPDYNLYECWRRGVQKEIGCLVFARKNQTQQSREVECTSFEQATKFIAFYASAFNTDIDEALQKMNCPRPCKYSHFLAHQNFMNKQSDMALDRNTLKVPQNFHGNLLAISFMSGYVTVTKEEYFYDGYALMGETGGALGLFLGLSILGLVGSVYDWCRKKFFKV